LRIESEVDITKEWFDAVILANRFN
jgi:hypothetical protein